MICVSSFFFQCKSGSLRVQQVIGWWERSARQGPSSQEAASTSSRRSLHRVRKLHFDPGFVTAWPDKTPGAQFPICKMSRLDQADLSDT